MDEKDQCKQDYALFAIRSATSTKIARDIANYRGSYGHPDKIHEEIMEIVEDEEDIKKVEVLDAQAIQDNKMMMLWNVGKGAVVKPKVVIVHYKGNPDHDDVDFAIVGKGVTYDTGGLNIKGTGNMEDMYGDKGGAAATIGALRGVLLTKPKKNIVFSVGLAENACGSECYLPGDILTSMNGLTVEVGNTDAEGRLVMGDVMTYVQKHYKPKALMNIATLTGAALTALGVTTGALFSNDDGLRD